MSVQINAGTEKGIAGIYPVYINPDNYVKTAFDFSGKKLIISGKNKGKTLETQTISLEELKPHYMNMVFSESTDGGSWFAPNILHMERHFIFDAPTTLDAILLNKEINNRRDTIIENIHEKFNIYYIKDGRWIELSNFKSVAWDHPGMSRIEFPPIEATGLVLTHKTPENTSLSAQKIWINEVFKQSYNLRVVKDKNKILFFVDGKLKYQIPNNYASSRIGLFSDRMKADFNGITLFHLPE